MNSLTYVIDKFVSVKAGEAYRLLPFGKLSRGGVTRDITPEYAAQFKLPPFVPPIKLGSHEDTTPAGGHITKLEVRADGLYGYPEFTEKGLKAYEDGDYRFHSPEIIWDDGALETSDGIIAGPLIIGDALLHTPYLGNATAFYSTTTKDENMTQENIQVPKSFLETLLGYLQPKKEETPEAPENGVKPEELSAAVKERDDFRAKYEAMQADIKVKELKAEIVGKLQKKDDFGMVYVELKAADEAAQMMATMSPEQRDWCMRNFKAFIAQADESNLIGEKGKENAPSIGENPKAEFNAQVEKVVAEKKLSYLDAMEVVKGTHADLFQAAYGKEKK